jgi:hypothetical protein
MVDSTIKIRRKRLAFNAYLDAGAAVPAAASSRVSVQSRFCESTTRYDTRGSSSIYVVSCPAPRWSTTT